MDARRGVAPVGYKAAKNPPAFSAWNCSTESNPSMASAAVITSTFFAWSSLRSSPVLFEQRAVFLRFPQREFEPRRRPGDLLLQVGMGPPKLHFPCVYFALNSSKVIKKNTAIAMVIATNQPVDIACAAGVTS